MIIKASCEYYVKKESSEQNIKSALLSGITTAIHVCTHPENSTKNKCSIVANIFCPYFPTKAQWTPKGKYFQPVIAKS